PTSAIYPLSLHDALPILPLRQREVDHDHVRTTHDLEQVERLARVARDRARDVDLLQRLTQPRDLAQLRADQQRRRRLASDRALEDRKSTRLNSSHVKSSY